MIQTACKVTNFPPQKTRVNNRPKGKIYSVEPTKRFAPGTFKGPSDSSEITCTSTATSCAFAIGCDVTRSAGGGSGCSSAFAGHELFHHVAGVAHAAGQLFTAAELFDQAHFIGAELTLLVDVRHRSHQRTHDKLSVVLQRENVKGK